MSRWTDFFSSQDLRKRLGIWFLLIALIPLGWTVLISYEVSKSDIYNIVQNQLHILIFRQSQLFQYYFKEKEFNTIILSNEIKTPSRLELVKLALKPDAQGNISYSEAEKILRPLMTGLLKGLRFHNLYIVAPNSTIAFSVYPSPYIGVSLAENNQYAYLNEYYERSIQTQTPELASILNPIPEITLMTYIFVPLIVDSQIVASLLVELDTSPFYTLIKDYKNLAKQGGSGEMLLVGKTDHQLFSISVEQEGTSEYKVGSIDPHTPFGSFVNHLFRHQHIVTGIIDYENEKALVVGKHFLPEFNWAMVIEVKLSQLYAPIYKLQKLFMILAATTAVAVILAAVYVARKIAAPILALTRKTQLLARGDLSQRIDISSNDEIGRLGESFNHMAAQLDQMVRHLDSLVEKRTKEYEIQNIELEQTIQELRKTQDRLIIQEKLASLGALTAGIAHEIKNPLNFINNFAELCSQIEEDLAARINKIQSVISPEEFEEISYLFETLKLDLNKIYEHGKRADSIVRNMLQHSRTVPGQKEPTPIHPLLEEYISLSYHGMRAQDHSFNVKIEKDFDPSLPVIPIVPQEISRVFLNLLNNAYYAVLQKSKQQIPNYTPIVKITTENHTDFISIKFWDNGIGIPAEVFPKLFTPFFTTKPTGEGTGLGLSLSYNIIQGHSGSLTVQSTPGEYTEFVITLPTR